MSSSLGSYVCGMRNFLDQGFRSLPTILANCVLLLGLLQGNFSYIFFFIGLFILAPISSLGFNKLFYKFKKDSPNWYAPNGNAEQCQLFPVFPTGSLSGPAFAVPSYWVTIIAFFFSYLITNASAVYQLDPEDGAKEEAIRRRKFQTGSSIFVLATFFVIFMIVRFSVSQCETKWGMLAGTAIGGSLGYFWYWFLGKCGLGQFDDMFGIKTQIIKV
jgi:hypothetical protein